MMAIGNSKIANGRDMKNICLYTNQIKRGSPERRFFSENRVFYLHFIDDRAALRGGLYRRR